MKKTYISMEFDQEILLYAIYATHLFLLLFNKQKHYMPQQTYFCHINEIMMTYPV